MSKSLGNVVDPVNSELAKSMVFNPEAWRWYLMSQASTDLTNSTFSRQILAETLEHDLSSGIGTLMGRVTGKKFASGWPEYVNFDRSELSGGMPTFFHTSGWRFDLCQKFHFFGVKRYSFSIHRNEFFI